MVNWLGTLIAYTYRQKKPSLKINSFEGGGISGLSETQVILWLFLYHWALIYKLVYNPFTKCK